MEKKPECDIEAERNRTRYEILKSPQKTVEKKINPIKNLCKPFKVKHTAEKQNEKREIGTEHHKTCGWSENRLNKSLKSSTNNRAKANSSVKEPLSTVFKN